MFFFARSRGKEIINSSCTIYGGVLKREKKTFKERERKNYVNRCGMHEYRTS